MFKRRKSDDHTDAADAALPAGVSLEADPTATGHAGLATTMPGDTGLGVPPFRPAPPKEAPMSMSRSPFTPGATPSGATPAGPGSPSPATLVRPGVSGQAAPRAPARDPAERRTLVVGRGISVQGTVQDAERLVVEGTVEASMIHATELSISHGGMFKGEVEVEDAEVAGTFNGTLTARGNLIIRASGRVLGQARCRRLQVEDGGQLSGQMEMLSDDKKSDLPVRATENAD
ncbi:MAG TPA: polymer-forming cytoskeletal protein [Acetobacteraceae bacterium]